MSKITKKQIKEAFADIKALNEAAKVYSDINLDFHDLVKAQFCLEALAVKAKQASELIRQYEIQLSEKAVA